MWLKPQDLHITITMVPLETPEKLKLAKEVLQSLQTDIQDDILGAAGGDDPQPVILTLDGLQAGFRNDDPEECRIMHAKIKDDESYNYLVRITSLIITTFLDKGVMEKKDL